MQRRGLLRHRYLAAILALALAGSIVALVLLLDPSANGESGSSPDNVSAQRSGLKCPDDARTLRQGKLIAAISAGLREAPEIYKGLDVQGRRAIAGVVAAFDQQRGRRVARACGRHVAKRTIVVELHFPQMRPSASLSQGTLFVSRLGSGYRVWHRAH